MTTRCSAIPNAQHKRALVYAFRSSAPTTRHIPFSLWTSAGRRYRLRFQDGRSSYRRESGYDLMNKGISTTLPI
jgi:hypothetical protein